MIEKLRSNFKLTNVLVRILFVLCFVFANWQSSLAATVMVLGQANLYLAFIVTLFLGTVIMFLAPVLINLALNAARIYSVPRAEYCLIAEAFCTLGFFLNGVLNLINLFTPLALVWGGAIFPFVSSLVAAILFYRLTAKLYFNDVTVVNYFRTFAIVYLVLVLVLEVL